MPRRCSACDHEKRSQIDKMLAAGQEPYREIARRFSLSVPALERHKNNHVAQAVARAEARRETSIGESVLAKLDKLEQRLEVVYSDSVDLLAQARKAGDLAVAVRACNAIRNVLAESRQQIEVLGELRGELDRRPQINIATLAPMILQAFQQGGVSVEVRTAVARKLGEMDRTLTATTDGLQLARAQTVALPTGHAYHRDNL